ncbi:MAG: arginine--tRNA ligase [Dehalococcoidales bacterium]|nr:arginine--tRNA ligase [Dehalococcoidales bacterium]
MIKQKLIAILRQAVEDTQQQGRLPLVRLPEVSVEHPQDQGHGDYASSLPLKLARATGSKPLAIAEAIAGAIVPSPEIDTITVAPPGFINFTLKGDWLARQVDSILVADDSYGNIDLGCRQRVQLEFVSANPTGPLHIGHGRGAVLGSTLANVLAAADYSVEREYYVNDAGKQVDAFARSLLARYQQQYGKADFEMPADGYAGSYVIDLARELEGEKATILAKSETSATEYLRQLGLERMTRQIKADLEALGVTFDVWFNEQSLYDDGQYQQALSLLKEKGYIEDKEGATWFISTALGEDKDNVVVRSDGSATYFATDIAYHYNKFIERRFDRVIDIWGADHQGHVSRMKAVVGAFGIAPERLQILISQLVTLRRGEELVRVSKRSGDIITLREVIDEVGADACRFFFLSRSADSQMDFDLELAKQQSLDNPVYYVQYAHARIASILRLAEQREIDYSDGDVSRLTTEPELSLIRKMLLLPEVIEVVALTLGPHRLAYYAQELATVFHGFYTQCRVVSQDDEQLTKARLKLVAAAKIVLAKTLHLMGMTAPETM